MKKQIIQFSRSVVSDCLGPHESQYARPPCPSPTPRVHSNSRPSSQWCHPAIASSVIPFSSCPQPSQHQSLFQWVNTSHEVAKVLEFQLSIIPSKEIPGLISFRMDWLDLFAVQGTLKTLLQHHSSKASILWLFLYEKDLHDQDNYDGVITHLEPDILECEVKWALRSITMNKASRGDGILLELFQILKDDAVVKCCTQYASKFGKLTTGHRSEKGQFSFQSQRKAMPKNAQTTAQLHSSHTLVK